MTSLRRDLSLFPATALVIGSVIGSGIFVSSAGMARSLGSARLLLFVWLLGGVFTLLGALTQCELVGQMPRTGGLYTYLKETYGEAVGFFYGWANFMIAGSGAIAAISYIFALYLDEFVSLPHLSPTLEKWPLVIPFLGTLFPLENMGTKAAGGVLICALTYLNIRGVKLGALVQSVSTSAKVLAIVATIGAAFLFGHHAETSSILNFQSTTLAGAQLSGGALLAAIVAALSGAFWAYDGWGNIAYIGDEVKDPKRTIPRAVLLGFSIFTALYLLINVAYLYILPIGALGSVVDDRVASAVVSAVAGKAGVTFIALLILLSTFDTVNSSILTNARVYIAMANEGLFWKRAGHIHERYRTPDGALIFQGVWSLVLLFSGSFDLVTSMYVFVNWVLYVLMGLSVFVLRRRSPNVERPFSVPGYPWVPLTYVVFSVLFVGLTLRGDILAYLAHEQPVIKSLMGVVLVFAGAPLYWRLKRTA